MWSLMSDLHRYWEFIKVMQLMPIINHATKQIKALMYAYIQYI